MDRLPRNHGEWLMACIKLTQKAMNNPPLESEQYLVRQISNLKSSLDSWKKLNPNAKLRQL